MAAGDAGDGDEVMEVRMAEVEFSTGGGSGVVCEAKDRDDWLNRVKIGVDWGSGEGKAYHGWSIGEGREND